MIDATEENAINSLRVDVKVRPTPFTLHPQPYTHPDYILHPAPYTLHPKPLTLSPKSSTRTLTLRPEVHLDVHAEAVDRLLLCLVDHSVRLIRCVQFVRFGLVCLVWRR